MEVRDFSVFYYLISVYFATNVIVNNYVFVSGSDLDKFHGDLYLTVKLLLPGVIKSVYNLNDKQIVKLFSRIFRCNQEDMVRDLEQVCVITSTTRFH